LFYKIAKDENYFTLDEQFYAILTQIVCDRPLLSFNHAATTPKVDGKPLEKT
jgi:hypothetical protein